MTKLNEKAYICFGDMMNIDCIKVGELRENCYILTKNEKCVVIDPGDEFEKIDNYIINPQFVLITHNHFDHVSALMDLKEKYDIPIYNYYNLEEKKYNISDFEFEVVKTPGHTSDSISFYFEKEQNMFTGDFLFNESVGRVDMPTGNIEEMIKSINKIRNYCDIINIYPGHGRATNLGFEKENNIYFKGGM